MNNDHQIKDSPSSAAVAQALETLALSGLYRTLRFVSPPQDRLEAEQLRGEPHRLLAVARLDGRPAGELFEER